jgi:hypothetical protein
MPTMIYGSICRRLIIIQNAEEGGCRCGSRKFRRNMKKEIKMPAKEY